METTDQNSELPDSQPTDEQQNQYPIDSEQEPGTHRSWPMLLALVIAALAFAILVVLTGRFIYHKLHHTVTPAPAQTENVPKSPSGSVTNPNSSTSGTTNQLTNTGPGDVVAIFAVSSFAAASLHYIISLRKQV